MSGTLQRERWSGAQQRGFEEDMALRWDRMMITEMEDIYFKVETDKFDQGFIPELRGQTPKEEII